MNERVAKSLREGLPPLYPAPSEPRRHRTAFGGGASIESCDACESVLLREGRLKGFPFGERVLNGVAPS